MISSKQLFIKFLKENNSYEPFMANFNAGQGKFFPPKYFFLNTSYLYFVSNAFTWKETSQGYDYWDKIDNKWWNNFRTKGLI